VFWVIPEFLYWWVKDGPLPTPLVTTSPSTAPGAGSLGGPGTVVLLGGSGVGFGGFAGGRVTAGAWLDTDRSLGLEARGFALESRLATARFSSDPSGNPRLGVPFFNAQTGNEDVASFAVPGSLAGSLATSYTSQLWGAEGNLLVNFFRDCGCTLDLLVGFRYAGLHEHLNLVGSSAPLGNVGVAFEGLLLSAPAVTATADTFRVLNNFYGGQLGLRTEHWFGPFFLGLAGRLALGSTHQEVDVAGQSAFSVPAGLVKTSPGGVFAQRSNFGRVINDDFAVLPEVEMKVGYQINRYLKVHVGGTFLYWSSVARAGEQIDRTVAPSQAPTFGEFNPQAGATRPMLLLRTTDFWATGISLGIEVRY
jgi:hypothetical protein